MKENIKGVFILKKRYVGIALFSGLLLAGCSSEIAQVQDELDSVTEAREELVVSLNDIQLKETEIQTQFDQSIAENEKLTNFSDETASIFENIASREETLVAIQETIKKIEADLEDFAAFEDEKLPWNEMNALTGSMEEINTSLETYLPDYEEQLTNEKEIFQSFGADDADFTTFYSGVDQLNTQSDENVAALEPLGSLFSQFDEAAAALQNALTALSEE